MFKIIVLGRLRQKAKPEFKASLSYIDKNLSLKYKLRIKSL